MHTIFRPQQPGQALVEFLLVIPILLMLLLGLVDVGQILLANYTVSQAARASAHQAALAGGDDGAATQTAGDVLDGGVGTAAADATVTVRCPRTPCRRYDPVTVAVTYQGTFWAPIPGLFDTFTARASATRAAERDAQ